MPEKSSGLPTSPSISVTTDSAGNEDVRIVLQTSDGRVLTPKGPGSGRQDVESIFWRQEF